MIRARALEGLPFPDLFIFDVHAHVGAYAKMQTGGNDIENILSSMDQMGVNKIAISSLPAINSACVYGNRQVAHAINQHPDRVFGYLTATPHDETYDFISHFEEGSFWGIKIHGSMNQTDISNPAYLPYLEYADARKIPVLFHAWEPGEVRQVRNLAGKFRNCPLILGHSGFTSYAAKQEAILAIKQQENIYLDTAISSTYDGAIEWIVSKVGVDRVLFGSDVPFFEMRHNIGKLALSKLSDEEKAMIFGLNAKRLFSL